MKFHWTNALRWPYFHHLGCFSGSTLRRAFCYFRDDHFPCLRIQDNNKEKGTLEEDLTEGEREWSFSRSVHLSTSHLAPHLLALPVDIFAGILGRVPSSLSSTQQQSKPYGHSLDHPSILPSSRPYILESGLSPMTNATPIFSAQVPAPTLVYTHKWKVLPVPSPWVSIFDRRVYGPYPCWTIKDISPTLNAVHLVAQTFRGEALPLSRQQPLFCLDFLVLSWVLPLAKKLVLA